VALERAKQRAAAAGAAIAARITWQQADVFGWDPAPRRFDLVSAQYLQLPDAARMALHRRLAEAVRPGGGSLLIVGHHPADMLAAAGRPHPAELFSTAEEIAATLEPDTWQIVVATARERQARDPAGHTAAIRDSVLHARRL
jgi:hypothetical protein